MFVQSNYFSNRNNKVDCVSKSAHTQWARKADLTSSQYVSQQVEAGMHWAVQWLWHKEEP